MPKWNTQETTIITDVYKKTGPDLTEHAFAELKDKLAHCSEHAILQKWNLLKKQTQEKAQNTQKAASMLPNLLQLRQQMCGVPSQTAVSQSTSTSTAPVPSIQAQRNEEEEAEEEEEEEEPEEEEAEEVTVYHNTASCDPWSPPVKRRRCEENPSSSSSSFSSSFSSSLQGISPINIKLFMWHITTSRSLFLFFRQLPGLAFEVDWDDSNDHVLIVTVKRARLDQAELREMMDFLPFITDIDLLDQNNHAHIAQFKLYFEHRLDSPTTWTFAEKTYLVWWTIPFFRHNHEDVKIGF
ncbi:hypothetical protein QOT17_017925 [Balamuthia mandrillaris]